MPDEKMIDSERPRPLTAEERDELEVRRAAEIAQEERIRRSVKEKPIMGGAPGEEEARRGMVEVGPIPEAARLYGERIGLYPMEGKDLVELISEAEVGEGGDVSEIADVLRQALAFREGLIFGPEGENIYRSLKDPELIYLHNLFTTVEGSTARPNVFYLDAAIKEALGRRIREAERFHQSGEWWEKKLRRRLERVNKLRKEERRTPLSEEEINNEIEQERRLMENTYEAVPKLLELQNRVEARGVVDQAFIQRMGTCEDPGSASGLLNRDRQYRPSVTPDKGHWRAFFQGEKEGEFGHEVNKVFWEIVKFGLPDQVTERLGLEPIPVYVREQLPEEMFEDKEKKRFKGNFYVGGFDNMPIFKAWLSRLMETSNNRMDIIWNAWKLAMTWEITSELGITIDEKEKEGKKERKYKIAFPPIGNALLTWTAHIEERRLIEFGLTINNERLEDHVGKYVTHSGLPMSLGKFPPLCQSFLHNSQVELKKTDLPNWVWDNLKNRLPNPSDPDYKKYDRGERYNHYILRQRLDPKTGKPKDKIKISLWDLGLYGGMSFAHKEIKDDREIKFPWFLTEVIEPGETPGELPAGSFGNWLLKRYRCMKERGGVLVDIRMRPSIQELADPDFFASRVRDWDKVLGEVKDVLPVHEDYLPPEKNPRAWWVAGILYYHFGGRGELHIPLTKGDEFREYRTTHSLQSIERAKEAKTEKGTGIGDVLHSAVNCGFLREADRNWILQQIGVSLL